MPFKSQAQRRFMYAAESRGEIPQGTARRWEKHTPKDKALPERTTKHAGVELMKTAFFDGFEKRANMLYHGAELAGLGILAAPSASNLAGKPWKEKNKEIAEVAGLGVLAAPSVWEVGKKLLRK